MIMYSELNETNKVASYVGWLFATPLKPILTEIADGFPLLFNHGSQGSGKTSLAQLFMRLVGILIQIPNPVL